MARTSFKRTVVEVPLGGVGELQTEGMPKPMAAVWKPVAWILERYGIPTLLTILLLGACVGIYLLAREDMAAEREANRQLILSTTEKFNSTVEMNAKAIQENTIAIQRLSVEVEKYNERTATVSQWMQFQLMTKKQMSPVSSSTTDNQR